MLQTKLRPVWIRHLVFFSAIAQRAERYLSAQHGVPVDAPDESFDLVGTQAGSIETADQTSHAGSGNVVHRDMVLLDPSDHSDVCQTQRSTTLKHQTDL